MPKIVFNRLLNAWFVVRGVHHTPLTGAFPTKAAAQAWLQRKRSRDPEVGFGPVFDRLLSKKR